MKTLFVYLIPHGGAGDCPSGRQIGGAEGGSRSGERGGRRCRRRRRAPICPRSWSRFLNSPALASCSDEDLAALFEIFDLETRHNRTDKTLKPSVTSGSVVVPPQLNGRDRLSSLLGP